jgi:3-isopropylmalate/(R)-2-methylmalate dehydratase large subunit
MEGRMTICNMSIEWGAKAGMIAPDETTFDYLKGRPHAPEGEEWDAAVAYWKTLHTDEDAVFDAEVDIDASKLTPFVTWGTNPGQGVALGEVSRTPRTSPTRSSGEAPTSAAGVHGPGRRHADARHQGRHGVPRLLHQRPDRGPAPGGELWQGPEGADGTACWWCPARPACACRPRRRASTRSSSAAGAEWREAGCSMCLGMNPDQLTPGERSASTSNRNFEGRQGKGGRTHLVSPAVAAATAMLGHLAARPTSNH